MSSFTGTGTLARHLLRQDRIRIAAWVLVLPLLAIGTAAAYDSLYPTVADRQNLDLQYGSNKAIALITGPVHGLSTAGGFTEWRLGGSLATLAGLMALFMIVRHTRADEESGRAELIAAGRVGRLAPLAAALLITIGTCLLLGGVLAAGMTAAGTGARGSIAIGAATALAGIVFASVAAVTSQLSTAARTASGLAGGVLAATFLLRGLGDSTDTFSWLSWLSPVGWAQQLRPYNGERWWVLLLSVALAVVLIGGALALRSRRDLGSGLVERNTGPSHAAESLRSTAALAWRQHRIPWLAWMSGAVIWGLLFGSLANAIVDIAASSPQIQIILERMGGSAALTQIFVGTAVGMMAMIVTFFVAQALMRAREEEATGRAELLLSTPTSRLSWLSGHVVAAYAGIAAILLASGLALGLSAHLASPDVDFWDVAGSAAAHIPAAWIVAGACLCVYGWLPTHSSLMWVVVGAAMSISLFGQLLNAPEWVLKISPFTTAPIVGPGDFEWGTLLIHLAIAGVLLALGVIGVRRRDLTA